MVWRRPGDKPLSEPIRVDLPTHICVTWPQWDIHVVLILFPRLEIRKRVGWNDKILSRHWLYCDEGVFCWHWGEKGSHGDYFVVPGCTGGGLHDHLQCHQGLQIRHHDCLSFSVDVFVAWWRHQMETFSALLALCAGNSPVTGEFPHKGKWRGTLVFSVICAWTNGWVNSRYTGDFRRHCAHYDVTVMADENRYWFGQWFGTDWVTNHHL